MPLVVAALSLDSQTQEQFALRRPFPDGVVPIVHSPDIALGADPETMRIAEFTGAPATEVVARRVEYHNGRRMRSAMEDVDLAGCIGGDCGDSTELPPPRHGVGLLPETNLYPVLEPASLVRVPAFLRGGGQGCHAHQHTS